jgi:hypothetical protein
MVPKTSCTCGEPGVACAGGTCTPNGWECPDGGVDADAGGDGPTDDAGCGDAGPNPYCAQMVAVVGELVICADSFRAATCVDDQWKCGPGDVPGASCTCAEFSPPGCNICTPHGWACPDAGVDGVVVKGPLDDAGTGG